MCVVANLKYLSTLFIIIIIINIIKACKTEWWGAGVVICLERGADMHMAQLMPLPLTVSCFSKIQTGFTFLAPAHPGSPGKGPLNSCCCIIKESYIAQLSSQRPQMRYVGRDGSMVTKLSMSLELST